MTWIEAAGTGRPSEVAIAGQRACCDQSGVLFFPDDALLVVSDLHLEKGAAFARRGSFVPPYDTAATLQRLGAMIARYRPKTVISLGDSFHDRRGASEMPAPFRGDLVMLMAGRTWLWVAGNHDPDAPAGVPGETVKEVTWGPLMFRHQPSARPAAGEIAGHLHPCARIVQRGRSVRRRCFASDGRRLVMPAFGAYTGSLNVLDRAYAGLFSREALTAYLLGDRGIYAIAGSLLRPG
jgi:DNA ligase-associated metallophosphoesterase